MSPVGETKKSNDPGAHEARLRVETSFKDSLRTRAPRSIGREPHDSSPRHRGFAGRWGVVFDSRSGTFVREQRIPKRTHLTSFTQDMDQLGLDPSTTVIQAEVVPTPQAVRAAWGDVGE